jgi:hypothetical protein
LSQALPPLPDSVLGDVAEAFRSLEADRQELNDFIAARDSAERFLKEYRRYIQIAARRRAEEVRKAHSAYETTMRQLRAAQVAFDLRLNAKFGPTGDSELPSWRSTSNTPWPRRKHFATARR